MTGVPSKLTAMGCSFFSNMSLNKIGSESISSKHTRSKAAQARPSAAPSKAKTSYGWSWFVCHIGRHVQEQLWLSPDLSHWPSADWWWSDLYKFGIHHLPYPANFLWEFDNYRKQFRIECFQYNADCDRIYSYRLKTIWLFQVPGWYRVGASDRYCFPIISFCNRNFWFCVYLSFS